ncbi:MAG: PPE domain-containing protein [Kibdelosporangium sp.]
MEDVYIDGHGTLAPGSAGERPLTVGDLVARIAANAGTAPANRSSADGTRTVPMPGGALYDNVDHPTLKAMVTENVDPDQVGAMASAWQRAGDKLAQFQDDVTGAINTSRGEWQGEAGDAARRFIADVGRWIGDAGRGAQLAGTQAAKQSEALAAARNAMPEPVVFDVDAANAELRQITDPVRLLSRYAEHLQAYNAQQAAQRQAAAVVAAYDAALADSGTMPAFAPPPEMTGSPAGAPMPRSSGESAPHGTTPMSTTQTPPVGATKMPESSVPQVSPAEQQPAAMPVGGFAVSSVDHGSRVAEHLSPAVPGAGAAASAVYSADNGDDSFGGAPSVIGE